MTSSTQDLNGQLTRFTSTNPLGKEYSIVEDALHKHKVKGAMYEGRYQVETFSNHNEFQALLLTVSTHQAISTSTPANGTTSGQIRTAKKATGAQLARTLKQFPLNPVAGALTNDYDPVETPLTRTELFGFMIELFPSLKNYDVTWWSSGSSYIFDEASCLQGERGQRLYFLIKDVSDTERTGDVIEGRCWLAGKGYIKISSSGSRLYRHLFDSAMWQAARLDFIGGAICHPPLYQNRGNPVLINEGETWIDTREVFPDLTKRELAEVKRLKEKAYAAAAPAAAEAYAIWLPKQIRKEVTILMREKGLTEEGAETRARRKFEAAKNYVLYGDFVVQFADESSVTVAEILENPEQWHGVQCLDPLEPDHRDFEECGILWCNQKDPKLSTFARGDGKSFMLLASLQDDDQAPAPHLSEIALAEEFARNASNAFRWTPGMDWMHNQGSHWERDAKLQRYTLAKTICKRAAETVERDQLKAKTTSASTTHAVLNLARSEPGIVTDIKEWDNQNMILNTPAGAYDLTTGQLVTDPGFLFTQVTGITPTKTATPLWDKFVSEVFCADLELIEFIQRMSGYALTGGTQEQKLFYLYGSGANGKSVYLEVLRNIAGAYAHNLPSEALMTSKHERHPTTFAALHGKRIAISSEIEDGAHWAESKIKSLTGDATMTAHFMKQDEFEFPIKHKHILAGNFKPRLKGDDPAIVRRMVLIPFNQTFSGTRRDDRLSEKLKTEYSGILQWCIEGARKWAESGLKIPTAVINSSNDYMTEQNDIAVWMSDACEVGVMFEDSVKNLYGSYAAWKLEQGEKPQSAKAWSERLLKANYTFKRVARIEGARDRGFIGLKVRSGTTSATYGSSTAQNWAKS